MVDRYGECIFIVCEVKGTRKKTPFNPPISPKCSRNHTPATTIPWPCRGREIVVAGVWFPEGLPCMHAPWVFALFPAFVPSGILVILLSIPCPLPHAPLLPRWQVTGDKSFQSWGIYLLVKATLELLWFFLQLHSHFFILNQKWPVTCHLSPLIKSISIYLF